MAAAGHDRSRRKPGTAQARARPGPARIAGDAQRLPGQRPSPREFFDQMVAEYPDRLNPGPVWYSALRLLG